MSEINPLHSGSPGWIHPSEMKTPELVESKVNAIVASILQAINEKRFDLFIDDMKTIRSLFAGEIPEMEEFKRANAALYEQFEDRLGTELKDLLNQYYVVFSDGSYVDINTSPPLFKFPINYSKKGLSDEEFRKTLSLPKNVREKEFPTKPGTYQYHFSGSGNDINSYTVYVTVDAHGNWTFSFDTTGTFESFKAANIPVAIVSAEENKLKNYLDKLKTKIRNISHQMSKDPITYTTLKELEAELRQIIDGTHPEFMPMARDFPAVYKKFAEELNTVLDQGLKNYSLTITIVQEVYTLLTNPTDNRHTFSKIIDDPSVLARYGFPPFKAEYGWARADLADYGRLSWEDRTNDEYGIHYTLQYTRDPTYSRNSYRLTVTGTLDQFDRKNALVLARPKSPLELDQKIKWNELH
jgi:hypothetical protein